MKYLLIAALLVLLLLLLYSRVHPYLKILSKILGTLKSFSATPAGSTNSARKVGAQSKLVRCVGCETWIPADRAIGAGKGGLTYCSRECLEKPPRQKESKLAG